MVINWFKRLYTGNKRESRRQQCADCGCFVEIRRHNLTACERYQRIIQLRQNMTLLQIGRTVGLSRERVRQILEKESHPSSQ